MSKLNVSVTFANKDKLEELKNQIVAAVEDCLAEADLEEPAVTVEWDVDETE